MTDLTFAFFLLSLGLALSLIIGWMARCSQRLAAPANPSRHWQWSDRLNQAGWLVLLVSNGLLWIGALLGTLRLVPIALGGGSVLAGWFGILLAAPLILSALLWRLHLQIGLRQLSRHLGQAINQRLPQRPTQESVLQLLQFAGQLCVATVMVGFGFLKVIAVSGVLDSEGDDQISGWFYNSRTHKFDHGLDPGGIYGPFGDGSFDDQF